MWRSAHDEASEEDKRLSEKVMGRYEQDMCSKHDEASEQDKRI
jgi:hypothetical protein